MSDNRQNNLRQLRMILHMTQKDFLRQFFVDEHGKNLISAATLSNLESRDLQGGRGGERLNQIISSLSKQLSIPEEIFDLSTTDFNEKCTQILDLNQIYTSDKKDGKITGLLNRLTMYFADQITEGRLKRGEQIPSDRELAKTLCVGRSTIREALKVLDVLGIIEIRLGQGTYLANRETNFFSIPLSWSLFLDGGQIRNILTIRSILEIKSAELAAQCKDEALFTKLDDVFWRMRDTYERHDHEEFLNNDIEFHSCIAECSKNYIIYSMLQTIRNLLRRISGSGMIDDQQVHDIYVEHRKIYGAIISHNKDSAAAYMLEHVEHSSQRYDLDL